ncbi:MAG TPA: PD-(D/E)XK nuclease family transposase [Candidatus Anaerobutyricum faecale]|nr:PD-(D/E)XK nuclease family transposase [Candidatus Anaerobutyricum faecale]HJD05222.1 PD-(D/E)XK nuclease family transposase [Candidatus Mediterraneibacter caccogallinarum]
MANILQQCFPEIRTREAVIREISESEKLRSVWVKWNDQQQKEFLDCCTGAKGVRILYDAFFKEVMNPETAPERLEELLSLILCQRIRILKVLPNDSTRIADENSLVIMDIVIELEDHSIANVEVQKLGYKFPGERAACYSSDLLLRQYKRVKGEKGKKFSYRDIKKVYTIIFYEHSPAEFHRFPDQFIHRSSQKTDTGLVINLLQEYVFIPLDIFRGILHNEGIKDKLDAWLMFLSVDEPEMIVKLITEYPQFKAYYGEIYQLCRNTEKVMEMFSKELQELDRNTVQYMIDEMQEVIDAQKKDLSRQREDLDKQQEVIDAQKEDLSRQQEDLDKQQEVIDAQKKDLSRQQEDLDKQREVIDAQQKQIEELKARLAEK